jgi:hypothetical protein
MLASVGKGHYDAAFDTGTNICPTPFNPRLASVLFYPLLLELKKSALCSNDPISACPCREIFSLTQVSGLLTVDLVAVLCLYIFFC